MDQLVLVQSQCIEHKLAHSEKSILANSVVDKMEAEELRKLVSDLDVVAFLKPCLSVFGTRK